MADSIRIEDLREPVHSDAAAAAIEMVAGLPFELTAKAVIEGAREEGEERREGARVAQQLLRLRVAREVTQHLPH